MLVQDKILVKLDPKQTESEGGIALPDNSQETPKTGVITELGPGRFTESGHCLVPEVKEGDRVLVEQYAGRTIELDGQEHVVVTENDILYVYKDPNE